MPTTPPPTPLAGIAVPTYGPTTFNQIAAMAAGLEAIAVPRFASELARDQTIPEPAAGQCCHVASTGLCVWDGTTWRYLALASALAALEGRVAALEGQAT